MCAWRDGSFHSISDFLRVPARKARGDVVVAFFAMGTW